MSNILFGVGLNLVSLQKHTNMQTISIIPDFKDGRFFFDLPEDFKNREIIIQIILKEPSKSAEQITKERLSIVKSFAGIAKKSDFRQNHEEWYLQ
jgi:hypothetical protein